MAPIRIHHRPAPVIQYPESLKNLKLNASFGQLQQIFTQKCQVTLTAADKVNLPPPHTTTSTPSTSVGVHRNTSSGPSKGGRKMEGSPITGDRIESQPSATDESQSPNASASMEQDVVPSEENRLSQLMYQVFNEPLLREMIIDHVIHQENRVSKSKMATCRLVQKCWLHTVSKLLRKQRVPLFSIHLCKKNEKSLDQFLKIVSGKTSPTFEDVRAPPFAIIAGPDFFEEENYTNFRDVLLKLGSGLVNIKLQIPKNGGCMSFIFPFSPKLSLPLLTDFTVRFANGTDGKNSISVHLIQSILNASHHSLKSLYLPLDTIPSGMGYVTLPVSLTTLDLSAHMKNKDLKMLLNNSLPNLKDLSLRITQAAFDDGMISQVLATLSETLEKLTFWGVSHDTVAGSATYFKFPVVMKKLKEFVVLSAHLELEYGLSSLETSLPEMKNLVLGHQTFQMFRKWTVNSKFENVTGLVVLLVDKNFAGHDENYYDLNIEVDIMQCLHLAFPNLKVLEMILCGTEMSGLEYLFLEMNQLEELVVSVGRTETLVNSDFWDSVLIGVRLDFATAMRTFPDVCETFEIKDATRPSIRNLSKLKSLKIKSIDRHLSPDLVNVPLISDSVFHFGFLKMPNLAKLVLGGRFTASAEMNRKWTAKPGRSILTS